MVDNITLVSSKPPPKAVLKAILTSSSEPVQVGQLLYTPIYSNGLISRYQAKIKNLRLIAYSNKMILQNSIHKYAHGSNHTDFFISEILPTIESISELTGVNWEDALIRKIEVGCNIIANPIAVVDLLDSYKGKSYLPMTSGGKVYGASVEFSNYVVKFYDKVFSALKMDNIMVGHDLARLEMGITKMVYLSRFLSQSMTAKDILSKNKLTILARDVEAKFDKSLKINHIDFSSMTIEDIRVIAVMQHPEALNKIKQSHHRTYKRYFERYKSLLALQDNRLIEEVTLAIKDKFQALLEG